jgi:hypothetical protein
MFNADGRVVGYAFKSWSGGTHPGSIPGLSFTAILKCCLQPM